jgi:hypothetical protein
MIKQKIKELVYGAEVGVKDVNPQITDAVTQIGQLKNDVSFNEETDEVKVEKPKTTRKTRPNPLKGEKGFVSRVKKEVSK